VRQFIVRKNKIICQKVTLKCGTSLSRKDIVAKRPKRKLQRSGIQNIQTIPLAGAEIKFFVKLIYMEVLKLKDLSYEAMCAIIAQVVHAANRQYVEAIGGKAVNPTWEQLPEVQKQSLIKAICETILKPKTPEASHDAWCVARKAQGYTLGVRIDHIRKTHTNLVPFRELTFEEQLKDALFLGITSIFASALDLCGSTPDSGSAFIDEDLDEPFEGYDEVARTVGDAAEAALDKMFPATEDDSFLITETDEVPLPIKKKRAKAAKPSDED
jgi:hypothetical protein